MFIVSLLALFVNGREMQNGETVAYRYLPIAVARDKTFRLDAFPHLDNPQIYTVQRNASGHLVSRKTALPALFEAPFFMGFRVLHGYWPDNEADMIALGKITMSLLAALAAAFLSAALLPLVKRPWVALAAGPGLIVLTPFWFPAQGAWVHPLLGALNAAALWMLARKRSTPAAWGWIGLTQGLAVASRIGSFPTALVFAVAAWLAPAARRAEAAAGDEAGPKAARGGLARLGAYLAGALPPLAFLGIYNALYFGSPLQTAFGKKPIGMIRPPFEGLAGLLVSPGEGILLFSPALLLALLAWRRPLRQMFVTRVAFWALLAHTLYWASYMDWWGGSAWGPRYLAEAIPFAILLAALGLDGALTAWRGARRRALGWAATGLCAFSLAVQAVGMFTWDNTYHQRFDPGFWVNEGDHWAWKAPYEPWWSLRNLPAQTPDWLTRLRALEAPPAMQADTEKQEES